MARRKLKVLLLYDVPFAPRNGEDPRTFMHGSDWRDERDVLLTLTRLGHTVKSFGVFDRIEPLVEELSRGSFDVVFNLCESFRSDREGEANVPALLQLMGVPCTGAGPKALALCRDKALSKEILDYHHVAVPHFVISRRGETLRHTAGLASDFPYPGICKPLNLDASVGIAQVSVVTNQAACTSRLHYLHEHLGADAIVEEFIDGREIYVGVFGNTRLTALPPQELVFRRPAARQQQVLTYRAKWDSAYRSRHGISSRPCQLPPAALAKLQKTCKTIYRLLHLTGYARIDLRLRGEQAVCLEVNPNPSIKRHDDFAESALAAGLSYDALIDRLVHLALPPGVAA